MSSPEETPQVFSQTEATKPVTHPIDVGDCLVLARYKVRKLAQALARQAAREDHACAVQEANASTISLLPPDHAQRLVKDPDTL
jgi:hypothetical protein